MPKTSGSQHETILVALALITILNLFHVPFLNPLTHQMGAKENIGLK